MSTPIILDCDPGHDDAIAILLALASPEVELVGITTVSGNQTVDKTTANALRILELAGRTEVPVYAGADRPILRERDVAAHVHGESGLDGPELPPPSQSAAEFNIWADPEAAERVFSEGRDTTMVGLDVTHRALIKDEHTERMRGAGKVGKVVAELMDFYSRFHRRRYPDLDGSPMHDPVCIAHLVDPTLMEVRDALIEVDCTTGPSWGRTNVDWRGREHFGPPNAKVGVDIDGPRFAELVVERISSLG